MPKFETTRHVRHRAAQMFDLVADVEKYPEFLPLCRGLTVRKRQETEAGRVVLIADMEVGYKAIRERFKSRVTLDPAKLQILVEYIDGPFSKLVNRWIFRQEGEPEGCSRVDFAIDYEFRNKMLGILMGAMFDQAFRRFSAAFEARADKIYGRAPKIS